MSQLVKVIERSPGNNTREIVEAQTHGVEMKILDQYSPEEYASFWGCDPCYDMFPRLPGDGYLFYNFSSEAIERTPEWLTKFLGAIDRTIKDVGVENEDKDVEGLTQLRQHVQELLDATKRE